MSSHSKSPWGWGLREFGDHMVFKGDGEGISCRQQSIKVGGGLKLTANQMGIIRIFIGGGGGNQINFVVTKPKFTSPFQTVNNNQSPRLMQRHFNVGSRI